MHPKIIRNIQNYSWNSYIGLCLQLKLLILINFN